MRDEDDVADGVLAGEEDDHAVDGEAEASAGRCCILKDFSHAHDCVYLMKILSRGRVQVVSQLSVSGQARYQRGLARTHLHTRNLRTKGDVSPFLMKWPDGPSPRNSENQDSCSISSFRIAETRSKVLWSFPEVMLHR